MCVFSELHKSCRQDIQANTTQETSTSAPDRWLVFEVTDTGCGIAKEGLHALFNDYVQVAIAFPLYSTLHSLSMLIAYVIALCFLYPIIAWMAILILS